MLLTTFFYNHNEKINAQREKRPSKLIAEHFSWLQQRPDTGEKFGLISVTTDDKESPITENVLEPLHFDRNNY